MLDKPYIVVATNNRSPITRETARDGGADYVFWKMKQDYSPKLVMKHICSYYQYKIKTQTNEQVKVKKLSLEEDIKKHINKVGFTDEMIGKKYVIDSIIIVSKLKDSNIRLHRDVFPIIARKYKKSVGSINRAIETAINKAWSITDLDTLEENYPMIVGGTRGTPTNKEFIFHYANLVKNDCRHKLEE